MKTFRSSCRAGVVFLAVLGLWGTPLHGAVSSKVLHVGNGADPQSLDPHIPIGLPEFAIVSELFDGLTSIDAEGKLIPNLAVDFPKVSKDGKTYTYTIRKDAKWSDGRAVTAEDFVYSWRRLANPKTGAAYAQFSHYLLNGKKINEGKIKDLTKLGVKALAKDKLQVRLAKPTAYFNQILAVFAMYPVPQHVITKHGDKWTKPGIMVSNGPFVLEDWKLSDRVVLRKNPLYWDAANVKLDKVVYYPIENRVTEERMFRAKDLHVTSGVPLAKAPLWKRKKGVLISDPDLATAFITVNVQRKPLSNVHLRRALALAIDRKLLAERILHGLWRVGSSVVPVGTTNFKSPVTLPSSADVKGAQEALAKAGYPGGKGLRPLEYMFDNDPVERKIAQALQHMWKKNLGIEVTLYNHELKSHVARLQKRDYDLGRSVWFADYNDANTFLELWKKNNLNNEAGWYSAEYETLLGKAESEVDPAKRRKLLEKAEGILMTELPVIPMMYKARSYLKRDDVTGWKPNYLGWHRLKYVSLK